MNKSKLKQAIQIQKDIKKLYNKINNYCSNEEITGTKQGEDVDKILCELEKFDFIEFYEDCKELKGATKWEEKEEIS